MSNLLKTELYKLFHSWYFWGIGIFNLLLSSILLLDSKERSSNLIMASLYNIPLLYFLSIVFIALFIGSDFSGRTLNTYITAGHKRSSIFRVKLIVSQIGCIIILVFPLFVHGIISQFYIGEKLFWNDSTYTMVLLPLQRTSTDPGNHDRNRHGNGFPAVYQYRRLQKEPVYAGHLLRAFPLPSQYSGRGSAFKTAGSP